MYALKFDVSNRVQVHVSSVNLRYCYQYLDRILSKIHVQEILIEGGGGIATRFR